MHAQSVYLENLCAFKFFGLKGQHSPWSIIPQGFAVKHKIQSYSLEFFSNIISKMIQSNCEMNVLDCMSPSNLNSANFICYLILS